MIVDIFLKHNPIHESDAQVMTPQYIIEAIGSDGYQNVSCSHLDKNTSYT